MILKSVVVVKLYSLASPLLLCVVTGRLDNTLKALLLKEQRALMEAPKSEPTF